MTAPGSTALPITCDSPKVISCAFVDHGSCVVHLVNNGAERKATVSGLPPGVKEYRVILTKNGVSPGMLPIGGGAVVGGSVELNLDAMSFTSLVGNP